MEEIVIWLLTPVVAKVQSPPDHPIEWCVESILSTLAIKCCVWIFCHGEPFQKGSAANWTTKITVSLCGDLYSSVLKHTSGRFSKVLFDQEECVFELFRCYPYWGPNSTKRSHWPFFQVLNISAGSWIFSIPNLLCFAIHSQCSLL